MTPRLALLVVSHRLPSACAIVGPATIPRDRFDRDTAIAES